MNLICVNLRDPTTLRPRRTGLRETNLLCVNLRDPTTLRLRRTGLRETKLALRKSARSAGENAEYWAKIVLVWDDVS